LSKVALYLAIYEQLSCKILEQRADLLLN